MNADSQQKRPCRFFASKSGCRAGDECPFRHNVGEASSVNLGSSATTKPPETEKLHGTSQTKVIGSQAVQALAQSRVVAKPTPQGQDPRDFQIAQVIRRFSPKESHENGGSTLLRFKLQPSDPDFPFELSSLDIALSVPSRYPGTGHEPSLKVKNTEIPVGFTLNIERGFDKLVSSRKDTTLLALINALDRSLEVFLSMEPAKVVKLISNADKRHLSKTPVEANTAEASTVKSDKADEVISTPPATRIYTADEKQNAYTQRALQVKQIESRLGRHKSFRKSSDGTAFILPVEPRIRDRLPSMMRSISIVNLYVPLLYPLEPCRAKFEGFPAEDSKPAELRFNERARESRDTSLMAHLNFLSQNLHTLALPLPEEEEKPVRTEVDRPKSLVSLPKAAVDQVPNEDLGHVVHIPRPPEWDLLDSSDSEYSDDYDYESSSEHSKQSNDLESGGVEIPEPEPSDITPSNQVERGTAISFPLLELFNIELLQVSILNLTVKCERCKEQLEATGLRDRMVKSFVCKKCSTPLTATFRSSFLHASSVRAGFIDLDGCSVVDMLPSTFVPTCSKCSTPWSQGIVSVRGETTANVCRESHCHQKFVFKIPQVKFLRISVQNRLPAVGPRRKQEVLGLVAGQPLPNRGACKHYRKSLRWFRFSCCSKIYFCDKCHDEAEEHPNEHANRMICGFCSREMNYRPEDCSFCHSVLIGKKGHGFWEGGKGTRDKVRMSRKDPRKFKRIGGGAK